jgi:Fe-S-cluster containining protein
MCGRCCRDVHLPLTIEESLAWLSDGHSVDVLCAAMPWPVEPPADHAESAYRRARSFVAHSGSLRVRVTVVLAANLAGACPNLAEDFRCRIHARRPRVCRIYPAEINPTVALQPANKACPPEAWVPDRPLFQTSAGLVSAGLQAEIEAARAAALTGLGARIRLCEDLGLRLAAVANEGYVIHRIDRVALDEALRRAQATRAYDAPEQQWFLVSDRTPTLDALAAVGAVGLPGPGREARPYRQRLYTYLPAQPAATPLTLN